MHVQLREQRHADRGDRGPRDRERAVTPRARDDLPAHDGGEQQPGHHRRQLQAGARRIAAAHDLQEERQEGDRAEERDPDDEPHGRAHHEDAVAKQRQRQDRLARAPLGEREEDEQDDTDDRESNDLRRSPRVCRAAEAREQDDGTEATGEERGAEIVDRVLQALRGRVERGSDDEKGDDADRHVDVEDPAPRQVVDEEAPDERPDDRGDAEDSAEQSLVAAAVARWDDVADDRDRDDDEPSGAEALQGPEDDQLRHVLREPAQHRSDEEDDDRGLDDDLASIQIAELPVQRARDGRREQVRGHDPREVREPAEVADDGRQSSGHDRLVERREEHDEHERAEDDALPRSAGGSRHTRTMPKVDKSEEQWRQELTREQFNVLRQKGTEAPFTGEYDHVFEPGTYRCAGCGAELFESDAKYDSGCGWPAFYAPAGEDAVEEETDASHGMVRTEVLCASCGGHLGHVFPDGPHPTGLRYCINSAALKLDEK